VGEWRYSSTVLNLSTIWRWVLSFKFRPLYPQGKRSQYPLHKRPGFESRPCSPQLYRLRNQASVICRQSKLAQR
jgi:hypothetical protein